MKREIIEMVFGAIPEGMAKLGSITREDLAKLGGADLRALENFLVFLDDIVATPDVDILRNSQEDKRL